ncbi:MAG: pitrilysin family protein [Planctomycetota bacterium]
MSKRNIAVFFTLLALLCLFGILQTAVGNESDKQQQEPARPLNQENQQAASDKEAAPLYTEEKFEKTGSVSSRLRSFILSNGMQVLIFPSHNAPVVTFMICYRTGSGSEIIGKTGISHFLEHMMFKGTANYKKGEIDYLTMRNGGYNNAATSFDYTSYYFCLASDRWLLAADVEADRMLNSLFDVKELESEKGVILSELNGEMDSPWGELGFVTNAVHWLIHPYRNPIIGHKRDVEKITQKDLFERYHNYYTPDNSFIVVVGDVEPDEAIKEVVKRFSVIPAAGKPAATTFVEPPQRGERRVVIPQNSSVARCLILFHSCCVGDADEPALDVTSIILSYGKSSRLYQRLVEQEKLVSGISASNSSRKDPGSYAISAQLREGAQPEKVEKIIFEELNKLKENPVTEEESAKAKNIVSADFVFNMETTESLAWTLSETHLYTSYRDVDAYLNKISSVTPEDIQKAAQKYFTENRTVGWSVPNQNSESEPEYEEEGMLTYPSKTKAARGNPTPVEQNSDKASVTKTESKPLAVKERTLPNGLTLLFLENKNVPAVALKLYVNAGQRAEPAGKEGIAEFVSDLLTEGTAKRSAIEISKAIESVGGQLSSNSSGVNVQVLKKDVNLAFELMSDIVRTPLFAQERIEEHKSKVLTSIKAIMDAPDTLASIAFNEMIYGNHPYHSPSIGYKSSITSITHDDVINFYKKFYVPSNCYLVVAGDISEEETISLAKKYFSEWENNESPKLEVIEPSAPAVKSKYIYKDVDQAYIYMGHLGIKRENPDYYALLVMDSIFGTGSGFTNRVIKRLRDQEGLAYLVYASIADSAGIEPGKLVVYAACDATDKDQMLKGLNEEIERIRKEKVSEEELQSAKDYLTGSYAFGLQTNFQLAGQIVYLKRYNLGFDYAKKYCEHINAVSTDDVLRVASKYLQPDKMCLSVCGRFNNAGTLIEK